MLRWSTVPARSSTTTTCTSTATAPPIEGWVHVVDGHADQPVTVNYSRGAPFRHGRASIRKATRQSRSPATGLEFWSPAQPRLYTRANLAPANDTDRRRDGLPHRRGATAPKSCSTASRSSCAASSIHAEAPYRGGRANTGQDVDTLLGWAQRAGLQLRAPGPLSARPAHDSRRRSPGHHGLVRDSRLLGAALRRSRRAGQGRAATQRRNSPRPRQGLHHLLVHRQRDAATRRRARASSIPSPPTRALSTPRGSSPPPCWCAPKATTSTSTIRWATPSTSSASNEYIGWYERTPRGCGHHHLAHRLSEAPHHQRIRRRRQGRQARRRHRALD